MRSGIPGNHINYGVREFGMAAIQNGVALHGGFIPYGATFLIFMEYARNAVRMSALMKQRVLYVFTHDSIGLGEDGPTHQPIEHLASLRAIPNLTVLRPADTVETLEAWDIAIRNRNIPSLLALSRQDVPQLRLDAGDENLTARGAYVLREASAAPKAILMASGSEVEIALDAKKILEGEGTPTRVVSVPCFELFEEQDKAYRESVLGNAPVRVGVEAAIRLGWDRFIGSDGAFIGMTGFGASAPAEELYKYFGITAEAVADAARERVKNGVPQGEDARQIPDSEPARPHP